MRRTGARGFQCIQFQNPRASNARVAQLKAKVGSLIGQHLSRKTAADMHHHGRRRDALRLRTDPIADLNAARASTHRPPESRGRFEGRSFPPFVDRGGSGREWGMDNMAHAGSKASPQRGREVSVQQWVKVRHCLAHLPHRCSASEGG